MNKLSNALSSMIIILFAAINANAQVTIGSDKSPNKGALLDLKEYDDSEALAGGRTAVKGLGMPRLSLTKMESLSDLGLPASSNDDHIGLVVYNLNQCLDYGMTDARGLYVWNGSRWEKLEVKSQSPEVFKYTDNRDAANPEVYLYRKFGDAGVWMLENMRAKIYAQGGTPPTLGVISHPDAPFDEKVYAYPASSGDGTNQTLFKQLPAIGLLYSWAAATNNENIPDANALAIEQGQVAGTVPGLYEVESVMPNGRIQGICPNGWHVPSDREWNMLEKEIALYPEKYSTNSGTTWDDEWETGELNRGDGTYGETLKTPCLPPGMNGSAVGKSFPASQGGFNLYLTGFVSANNGAFTNYGEYAYYRTSSTAADYLSGAVEHKQAYHRSLGRTNTYVSRITGLRNNLMPVRCKRDD